MKRTVMIMCLLFTMLLVACNFSLPTSGGSGGSPVESTATIDALIQTQLAEMISTLPTDTPEATATGALATLPPEESAGEATATQSPAVEGVATATPEIATATPEPVLQATATQTALVPTATPSLTPTLNPSFTPAPGDPRAHLGSPASSDPMNDARAWVWPTGKDLFTIGEFKDGYMVMTSISELDGWRIANLGREFTNTYLEAEIRTETCTGSDHYGIIFRVPLLHTPDQGYLFGLTCDGRYSLRRWDAQVGTKGEMKWLVNWTADSSIITGSNQANRLGVMSIGKRIFLYANGKLLTEVQDATYEKGYFGVFIGSDKTENMVIKVDNMSYWENPNP